jgi:hypothetical protein
VVNPIVLFILAAVCLGAAFFGNDMIKTYIADSTNAILVQVFVGVLGVVAALVGVKWGLGDRKKSESSSDISIGGDLKVSGDNGRVNIGHQIRVGEDRTADKKGSQEKDG